MAEETTQRIVENTTTQSNFTTPVSTPYVVTTNAKTIARTTLTKTAATTSAATISTNSATASATTPATTTTETNTTTTNGMKYEPPPNLQQVRLIEIILNLMNLLESWSNFELNF